MRIVYEILTECTAFHYHPGEILFFLPKDFILSILATQYEVGCNSDMVCCEVVHKFMNEM